MYISQKMTVTVSMDDGGYVIDVDEDADAPISIFRNGLLYTEDGAPFCGGE